MAVKDPKYPYVVKWGKMQGSDAAYIQEQVRRAFTDGAPANATHVNRDGTWSTTDDVVSDGTRIALGLNKLPPESPLILAAFGAEIISQQQASGVDNFLYRIRFPTLCGAGYWAETYKISSEVRLIGAEFLMFNQPVTVEFLRDQ